MALTVVKEDLIGAANRAPGELVVRRASITFDNSYPTGGEQITPSDFGLTYVFGIIPLATHLKTWTVYYLDTGYLVAVVLGTGAEVGNAVDLSTLVVDCLVYGT